MIRQFVAMPLRSGYTVEEQLTGEAEHGGIQLLVHPQKREAWRPRGFTVIREDFVADGAPCYALEADAEMGLGAGGEMTQEIYDDPHTFDDRDLTQRNRCFIHLADSLVWRAITGEAPPTTPLAAAEYTRAGLPCFDYYAEDATALPGGAKLGGVRSVREGAF